MSQPSIAVVDDDRSVVRSLARLLRAAGYSVSTFGSAQEFLDRPEIPIPSCLVLDVQMPEITGFELQSRLTALGQAIPIVFITAHDSPQTRASAGQGGRCELLFKPFADTAILAAIDRAMRAP